MRQDMESTTDRASNIEKHPHPSVSLAFRTGFSLNNRLYAIDRPIGGLPGNQRIKGVLRSVIPIDIGRYREMQFCFRELRRSTAPPEMLLDISSPRLIPLTIARSYRASTLFYFDIVPEEVRLMKYASSILKTRNIHTLRANAKHLPLEDNSIQTVTSISVFEHIAPEDGGEIPAATELGRVIAPGGIALLTVPFSTKRFSEYKTGRVYERTQRSGERTFFQRFYDLRQLTENIVRPSGMTLESLEFIEDASPLQSGRRRTAALLDGSPVRSACFGLAFPLAAFMFYTAPRRISYRPYIACIKLRKPRA